LAEHDLEHELALRIILEGVARELEVAEDAEVEIVDDLAAVDGVAGEPIGSPGDDPLGLAALDAGHHPIEQAATWCFRTEGLLDRLDDLYLWLRAECSLLRRPSSRRRRRKRAPSVTLFSSASSGFAAFNVTATPGDKKATRSCRCGAGGLGRGACGKAPRCQQNYQGRVSGPLMDRIDLVVEVPPVTAADLTLPPPAEGSAEVAARVAAARQIQAARAVDGSRMAGASPLNARAEGAWLDSIVALDAPAKALLARAAEANALTARGWSRTLRLARTIADLEGAPAVRRVHVAEALIYRKIGPGAEGVAAPMASVYGL
jgi:hypothetical protein